MIYFICTDYRGKLYYSGTRKLYSAWCTGYFFPSYRPQNHLCFILLVTILYLGFLLQIFFFLFSLSLAHSPSVKAHLDSEGLLCRGDDVIQFCHGFCESLIQALRSAGILHASLVYKIIFKEFSIKPRTLTTIFNCPT